jgi:integrating conjugative element membrane protein (TIGR03747 family)
MTDASPAARRVVRRSPLDVCISGLAQTLAWVLMSLLLAIVVECIGMVYWWPELGLAHSERLAAAEVSYLETDLRRSVICEAPLPFARDVENRLHRYLFEVTHVVDLLRWNSTTLTSSDSGLPPNYSVVLRSVARLVIAAMQVTDTFSLRLSILLLSLPLFAVFGAIAMIDGLVQRDVRRWSGGRESSFIYHWAKRLTLPLLVVCGVGYLASPFSLRPTLVILPISTVYALTVMVTASAFKKYA